MSDEGFVEELTHQLQVEFDASEPRARRVARQAWRARNDSRFGEDGKIDGGDSVATKLADPEAVVQYLSGTGPTDIEHKWNQRVGEWRHAYRVSVADLRVE